GSELMTMRTPLFGRPAMMLALTALVLAPGCKKDQETTNPDQITTNSDTGDEPEDEPAGLPPQDPDPAELAQLYERYLAGDYEAVVAGAEDLRGGLTSDTQVRANALASSIQALAAVENLPEDAKPLAEQAVADADRLADVEVQQLAHIAHGIYLVRVHEAAAGQ